MDKPTEFKKELKELLAKYNAEIWVSLDGDTHGVSCDIVIDIDNKEIMRTHGEINQYELK